MNEVSVPSRGLSYLNVTISEERRILSKKSFRPLTGTLLSKFKKQLFYKQYIDFHCFRPLTGTLLSKSEIGETEEEIRAIGFRPLTGTLLSKSHPPILPPQAAFTAGLRGK